MLSFFQKQNIHNLLQCLNNFFSNFFLFFISKVFSRGFKFQQSSAKYSDKKMCFLTFWGATKKTNRVQSYPSFLLKVPNALSVSHWRQVVPKKLGFPHFVHWLMFRRQSSPLKDFFSPLQKFLNDSLIPIGRISSTFGLGGSIYVVHGDGTLKSEHALHPSVLSVFAKLLIAYYAYGLFKIIIRDRQLSYILRRNTRFVSFSSCLRS